MSGLAGFLNLDGRPADPALLDRLLAGLAYRAPDGSAGVVNAHVALGLGSLVSLPRADVALTPVTLPEAELTLTFDGRIDNRADLCEALGAPPESTDAALVLAAVARWGRDAFVRLLGDFALALWDGRRQQLWLARDIHGVRPLYFRRTADVFMWASDLQTHVRWRPAGVNEGFVGEILADRVRHRTETIYDGILRLPAAHAGIVKMDGTWQSWRYWMPDPERTVRYRDEREYGAQFRELVATAVAARVRSPNGAAGLFFSGGVDSTVLALELARTAGTAPLLLTICAEGTSANEGPAARKAADQIGLPQVALPAYRAVRADYEADTRVSLDLPAVPMRAISRPLEREARRRTLRVVMTGNGHEEWFFGNQLALADSISGADVPALVQRLHEWRGIPGGFSPWRALMLGLWLQFPEGARRALRAVTRRAIQRPWIDPAFAKRIFLQDRLRNEVETPPFRSIAKALTWQSYMSGEQLLRIEHEQRALIAAGLDLRMPFFDRRLVELGLAIPEDVLCRDRQPRRVAFLAYEEEPLARLRGRVEGPDFSFMVAESVVAMGPEFLDELLEGPVGEWVQPQVVRRMWQACLQAVGNPAAPVGRHAFPLTYMMLVHFWLTGLHALWPGRDAVNELH
jgi:asparagine synthase (glutamine-hydrolysing)